MKNNNIYYRFIIFMVSVSLNVSCHNKDNSSKNSGSTKKYSEYNDFPSAFR